MISEARVPGPDESGPNLDSSPEINTFVENFSFVGMDSPDGTPRVVGVRTVRGAIFMSEADDAEDNIQFNANTRVVRVDPVRGRAIVTDVVDLPARHRSGMVRSYVIDDFTGDEPYVSWTGDDEFEGRTAFGFNAPDEGYIKIYNPGTAGHWDGREARRLVRSGSMDSRQWLEFSVANRVDQALQMQEIVVPDSPEGL